MAHTVTSFWKRWWVSRKGGVVLEKVERCCAPHEVQFHCEKPMFSSWCLEKVGWRLEKVGVVS
jgi:hypothetical protein